MKVEKPSLYMEAVDDKELEALLGVVEASGVCARTGRSYWNQK